MKSNLLRSSILALLILCLAMPGMVAAGEVKIALDSPEDLEKSGTYVWAKAFFDHLKANGVKTKLYPRDALGGEEEKLDQVSQGLLEVSMSDLAKAGQLDPTIFGFYLPYLFDSIEHMDQVIAKSEVMDKINAGTSKRGVRVLALVPVGDFSGLANTKHPVKTPADLKDLRMRALDKKQVKMLEALGASTVVIPWAEIYNALQTGVADGYLNPAIVPVMFKHTEVLKYYSDIKFGLPLRISICSADWYNGLSKSDRAIVDDAVAKANATNRVWQAKVAEAGLKALGATGVEIYKNNTEEIKQFANLLQPLYPEMVSPEIAKAFVEAANANR